MSLYIILILLFVHQIDGSDYFIKNPIARRGIMKDQNSLKSKKQLDLEKLKKKVTIKEGDVYQSKYSKIK